MPPVQSKPQNVMRGIGLKVASVTIFVVMTSMIKYAKDIPTGELVFFRSFFAMLPILVFLATRGELHGAWQTNRLPAHILRGLLGTSGMMVIFFALTVLPLPETITLGYAAPLLIVALSAIFLKERVRLFRWSAVLIGLIGVCIIIWPRLTLFTSGTAFSSSESLGVIATLVGAVFAASAMLTTRNLTKTEQSATIVLYFSLTSTIVGLLTLPFGWVMLSPLEWLILISAGILGGTGQIFLTESYRYADMSIIAPFEYSSILLGVILGYLVFGDVPTPHMLIGGAIVVAAGIAIILRERRLGLERAEARQMRPL